MFFFIRKYQSSKVMLPFYIPINNEWKFLLFHIHISIWCCQCFGLAILIVRQWYFTVVLFCISLNDIWPWAFFICLFTVCTCILVHFWIRLCWVLCLFWIILWIIPYQICVLQMLFLVYGLSFHCLDIVFHGA